ncbi:glycosyltransferase family 2 protein [candidate division KSB1 bacterium]
MLKISCVIVTFNSAEIIEMCIRSILEDINEYTFEIIVIDNASSDDTMNILCELKKSINEHLILIENLTNFGYTRAVNQGLVKAGGEYLLLLNPDTRIHKDFFKRSLEFFENNEGYGVLGPQHLDFSGNIKRTCREFPGYFSLLSHISGLSYIFPKSKIFSRWKMGYFDHKGSREVDQPMGACLFMRSTDQKEVGYLDERFRMFFSDVDMCRRFKERKKPAYFCSEIKIDHEEGHSIKKHPVKMIMSSHNAFHRYFRKYYNKWYHIFPNIFIFFVLVLTGILRILLLPFKR